VVARYQVSSEFNLVKVRTAELRVSSLAYPEFETDPHPALRHALSIDFATGKARHTDYSGNAHPLPAPEGHSRIAQRFNAGWDRRNGISPEGTAEPVEPSICTRHDPPVAIARHKTALTRYDLSKPVKSLLEYGVLRNGMSCFDE
jgi:hypothetical protein